LQERNVSRPFGSTFYAVAFRPFEQDTIEQAKYFGRGMLFAMTGGDDFGASPAWEQ